LQLLAEHPLERARQAVEACLCAGDLHAERIACAVGRLAEGGGGSGPAPEATPLEQYQVPRPDLGRYNQLLSQGDSQDG
jgi:hypothetical protein